MYNALYFASRSVLISAHKKKLLMQAPRTSVIPKAAVEEAKTLSVNGSASQNGTGLDFDELTDLIRCVALNKLGMSSWCYLSSDDGFR